MSGVAGHLVRRGVQAVATTASDKAHKEAYIQILKWQANQYHNEFNKIQPWEWMTLFFTAVAFFLLFVSIRYTLGEVVSSLAMIEEPSSTAVLAVSEDPDAPLEKDAHLEIVKEKPVTSSIRKTVAHLTHLGGFAARWRGLSASIIYHMVHGFTAHLLMSFLAFFMGHGPVGYIISSIMASVLVARIHMTWTHIMISLPSELPWYKRIPRGRFYFKVLALPSLVFAVSQQLCMILPAAVFLSFGGLPNVDDANTQFEAFRWLASAGTAFMVAIALVLPASVTLTRVEASLLPDDQETVVKFDRTLGGAAASAISLGPANVRGLFVAAWKTFDRAARLRIIKFYTKMFMIQTIIFVAFVLVIAAEISSFGPDRIQTLIKSTIARVQLEAMGVSMN